MGKLTSKVRLDGRCFFAGLMKMVGKAVGGKWEEIPEAACEAFGLDYQGKSAELCAKRLVTAGLVRGVLDLLQPYATLLPGADKKRQVALDTFLDQIPEMGDEIEVTPDILKHPEELPILKSYQARLEAFLHHRGLPEAGAGFGPGSPAAVAARLPWYFAQGLLTEYGRKPDDYRALDEYVTSPVADLWRREGSWEKYRTEFNRRLREPIFDEPYSLPDVFLWPNAYHVERKHKDRVRRGPEAVLDREPPVRHVVRLRDFLDHWLETATTHHAFRVLAGDPGGGKSSFARMFTAYRLEKGDRVLYVPLHALGLVDQSFHAALDGFCKLSRCPEGLLHDDTAPQRLLLVLDGLDELANQGEGGKTAARQFAEKVVREVNLRNGGGTVRVVVMFCGRPIPVSEVADIFCEPGQVLTLLPYATPKEEREQNFRFRTQDPHELLKIDSRPEWWKQFARVALGNETLSPPKYLSDERFFELTVQPMNNHTLAIVRDRVNLDDGQFSMNSVFQELLRRVYDRRWATTPGHKYTARLSFDDFRSLVSVLGQAAWQGGTDRVTTVADFERLCAVAGLGGLLDEYKKRFTEGSLGLFTAFYVKHADSVPGRNATFEFTQKRFGEYLAAVRIVDVITEFLDLLGQPKNPRQPHGAKYETRELLFDWLVAVGPSRLTHDMVPYIHDEVRLRDEVTPGYAARMQGQVIDLLNAALASSFPCEELKEEQTGRKLAFSDMLIYARNAEEALLCIHSAVSNITRVVGNITWPNATAAGDMICRLRGQRDMSRFVDVHPLQYLCFLKMSGQQLSFVDLVGANLTGSDLTNADMFQANLNGVRLTGANLTDANLRRINLGGVAWVSVDKRSCTAGPAAQLAGATYGGIHLDSEEGLLLLREAGVILDDPKDVEWFFQEIKKMGKSKTNT